MAAAGSASAFVFSELLELDEMSADLLGDYIPSFTYVVDELSEQSEHELLARKMTALGIATLLCLSRVHKAEDLVSLLGRYIDLLQKILAAPNGLAALATLLSYLTEVTEHTERVQELAELLGAPGEEAYITAAQMLREEGRAEGRAEMLLKVLELKFGQPSSETIARVRAANIEDLDRWVQRIISANSLEEVFQG
jgi:hypothetical protein